MKYRFLLVVFTVMFSTIFGAVFAYAQVPPGQSTVDRLVSLAASNSVEKIRGEGRLRCEYAVITNAYGTDPEYEAFADTLQEAQQRLALLCIKERCQQVGRWMAGALGYMDQVSMSDTAEFMRAQGYDDEKIREFQEGRATVDRGAISAITCMNSVPLGRTVVVDSCFMMPMQCR